MVLSKLTPEQKFTGYLSGFLVDKPWVTVENSANKSSREKELEHPELGKVVLRQYCRIEDLSAWENFVQVTAAERTKVFSWSRDGVGMATPEEVWHLLHDIETELGRKVQ